MPSSSSGGAGVGGGFDSAFTSPTPPTAAASASATARTTFGGGEGDWDSAFASSADNTPTHHQVMKRHSGNPGRSTCLKLLLFFFFTKTSSTAAAAAASQQSKLEFAEDPFKDSNYRYGDPFELAGADPFVGKEDPFTAPVAAAFGGDAASAGPGPGAGPALPASAAPPSMGDPFSLTTLAVKRRSRRI